MKGDIFHILNRGVEKRKIFLDDEDHLRFVYNLLDFNDKNLINQSYYTRRSKFSVMSLQKQQQQKLEKEELVNILCFCLMPNHYHILVQEKINGGAGLFSKKLTNGYTLYFNLKNDRSGVLFQGRSKIISIRRDEHFLHLPYYILSNPIKLVESKWKEDGIKNQKKVIQFLDNYKWSSYQDVVRKQNFPLMINKKLFFELFDTDKKQFKNDFIEWLKVGDAITE